MKVGVALTLGVLLVVAAPAMAAMGDIDVQARLPITATGHHELVAGDAELLVQGPAVVSFDNAHGTLHRVMVRSFEYVSPTDPAARVTPYRDVEQEEIPLAASQVNWQRINADHTLLLYGTDLVQKGGDLVIGVQPHPVTVAAQTDDLEVLEFIDNRPVPFTYTIPSGHHVAQSPQSIVRADGAMDAFLYGATIKVTDAEGKNRILSASERVETRPGTIYNPLTDEWTGPGSHDETVREYIQFDIQTAHASVFLDGPATLFSRDPAFQVLGTVHLLDAVGTVTVDESTHQLKGQDLSLAGDITLQARGTEQPRVTGHGDITNVAYGAIAHEYDWAAVAAAAGIGALIIGGLAWAASHLKAAAAATGGILMGGYARVQGEAVLNHKARRRIYDAIQENPGLSITDLGELAGCSGSTLNYHLRVLEKNDLVISQRDGRYLRFFDRASGLYANGRKTVVSALRNDTTAAIAGAILHNPGVAQCDLAEAFEIAPSTVNWHIQRLMGAGLVDKVRDAHFTRYYAGDNWAKLPTTEAARFGLQLA